MESETLAWQEEALDPLRAIVDPHHHLGFKPGRPPYLLSDLIDDMSRGHNIGATVIVESTVMYRADGPEDFRCIGETEFANGIAAMSASGLYGPTRVCAGIVGQANLRLGSRVEPVLDAHIRAGNGRFRGVRAVATWDQSAGLRDYRNPPPGLLLDGAFQQGFACLEPLGLTFETWIYSTQLADVINLADAFPTTTIIVDHMGGPLGVGPYAESRQDVLHDWRSKLRELSRRSNVFLKVGGLGMPVIGLGFDKSKTRPSSLELEPAWRPYIETCAEIFGTNRCMFESNFPPDKKTCDYGVLWNTFKRVAADWSEDEKDDIFRKTATRVYRL